ncbi:DMT family transporter [Flavihumibacter rivuli]|uniref:DMT family transporter n=1 Tax=Flavihumibacter rivuli TaxID=2838156 RepID=UPI001BDE6EDD|nr:DMT family transporter [Flavihumibacter rivuli]ULQ57081.1 DMT family transporter [Flavihumibacter rivuli]
MATTTRQQVTLAGLLLTLSGAILFSTKAVMVKLAFRDTHVDVVVLLALRMLFALPFYLGAVWMTRGKELTPLTRQQWLKVIVLGLMGYYLSSLFDFIGLQYITAGLERLILFLYPTFTALINHFVFGQRLSRTQRFALALTYAGILFAYVGEIELAGAGKGFVEGSLWVFACSITYAIYIAGSGRMIPQVGVTRFTAYAMLSATAGVFLHFLLKVDTAAISITGTQWGYGLMLGVIATVLPSFMVSAGTQRIGANNVAIISSIGPISTILQAWVFLGETIHWPQVVGTILVVAGVVALGWKRGLVEK